MKDDKLKKIMVGFVVVLVIVIMIQNRSYHREIKNLNGIIDSMNQSFNLQLRNLENNLVYLIDDKISERLSKVSDLTITYEGINVNEKKIKIRATAHLKEVMENSNILLRVTTQTSDFMKDFELLSNDILSYQCELELPYDNDYVFDLYENTTTGNLSKLNTKSFYKNVNSELKDRTRIMSTSSSNSDEEIIFEFETMNQTFMEPSFRMKNIEVKVTYGDQEVFREDVINQNILNYSEMAQVQLGIASGDIESNNGISEQYGPLSMDTSGVEYGNYRIKFKHPDIVKEDYPKYNIFINVTYENGESKLIYQQ